MTIQKKGMEKVTHWNRHRHLHLIYGRCRDENNLIGIELYLLLIISSLLTLLLHEYKLKISITSITFNQCYDQKNHHYIHIYTNNTANINTKTNINTTIITT
jgi:hypothetical protein